MCSLAKLLRAAACVLIFWSSIVASPLAVSAERVAEPVAPRRMLGLGMVCRAAISVGSRTIEPRGPQLTLRVSKLARPSILFAALQLFFGVSAVASGLTLCNCGALSSAWISLALCGGGKESDARRGAEYQDTSHACCGGTAWARSQLLENSEHNASVEAKVLRMLRADSVAASRPVQSTVAADRDRGPVTRRAVARMRRWPERLGACR